MPADSPESQPWIDILSEVRYLIEPQLEPPPELNAEENAVMTELRKRWEQEKAELRQQGKLEGKLEGKAEGKLEGKLEGEAKGKAAAILAVLHARGFAVSERTHTQVLGCTDVSTLDRWLVRAATAASETDILAA